MAKKKKYKVKYKIRLKQKLLSKKSEFIKEYGRFWEHTIQEPGFEYEIEEGDDVKAKKVSKILKKLIEKGEKLEKVGG